MQEDSELVIANLAQSTLRAKASFKLAAFRNSVYTSKVETYLMFESQTEELKMQVESAHTAAFLNHGYTPATTVDRATQEAVAETLWERLWGFIHRFQELVNLHRDTMLVFATAKMNSFFREWHEENHFTQHGLKTVLNSLARDAPADAKGIDLNFAWCFHVLFKALAVFRSFGVRSARAPITSNLYVAAMLYSDL